MKVDKTDVENAIMFFARKLEKEQNYKDLFKSGVGLTSLVPEIIYDLFLYKFNSYCCSDEEYVHYMILHEYATELKEKGWVDFIEK